MRQKEKERENERHKEKERERVWHMQGMAWVAQLVLL